MIIELIRGIPGIGQRTARLYLRIRSSTGSRGPFAGSGSYWQDRYEAGGDSGRGSYGKHAKFKAEALNAFVSRQHIESVIEFGCGDGNQLALADYPHYLGLDVSARAVALCRRRFAGDPTKSFELLANYAGERADLALSLDVVYHLVEDEVFQAHMRTLFAAARRHVILYSSNTESKHASQPHVRHRKFTDWVASCAPDWELQEHIPSRPRSRAPSGHSSADFYVFRPG